MSRLSVSHYVCPDAYPLARFLAVARDIGAGAVALSVPALAATGARELRTMLDDAGLAVSSLNSAGYLTYPSGPRWRDQDRQNRELVEAAAALGAEVLCVISGGLGAADATLDEARARIRHRLADLHAFAAAHEVRLGLEPIHPAEIMHKGCVNSIGDALAICDDLPGLCLVVDHYHSWWDPRLRDVFASDLPRVALVQICNVREPAPGQPLDREVLAEGQIDCAWLVGHAEQAGYDGWYEFELFARSLRGRPVDDVLAKAARAFDTLASKREMNQLRQADSQ
jgi:sugar phosphate isomerase/epimerase